MNSGRKHLAGIITSLVLAAFVSLPSASLATPARVDGSGGNLRNPGIMPPGGQAFGKSYGEWAVLYWQWAIRIPATNNPMLDVTGEFAAVGQSGPLWFLAGTTGFSAERHVTIPAGKALFFAVHPWIFGAGAFDCDPSVPGVDCDVPTLQAAAALAANAASVLEASIDGVPVNGLRSYRGISPGSFSMTLPEPSLFGLPGGFYDPQVADGYFLLLAPLSVGSHTITSNVVSPVNGGFFYTQVDHITVVPAGDHVTEPTTTEFWNTAGTAVTSAPAAKRTSWGQVKSIYR